MEFEDTDDTRFEDNIREYMLDEINEIRLNHLNDYALANRDILKTIYENGILDDDNIKKALIKPVITRIWSDYEIISNGFILENLPNPELIAYALKHDMFSKEELKLIPLDHGDTFQTIIDMYRKEDLLGYLKDELLNPKLPCYDT